MTRPRLLVIMGSGETSPTMSKVHRDVFDRLGSPAPAVVLDTPFGFQENADDIADRAVEYFRVSVKRDVAVASFRRAGGGGGGRLAEETAMARIREAAWVFSGPGSPSYALRQWRESPIPALLAGKLQGGGCVTFASAAAATLGRLTVPVYEIYKVGQDPHWIEGLDLLAGLGLPAVVIPHFNNAEGGHHDTRYCYLGERRLAAMEEELDEGEFVLGLDEHTGCIVDFGAGTASVVGLGAVTVRARGRSATLGAGETIDVDRLASLVDGDGTARSRPAGTEAGAEPVAAPAPARSPLVDDIGRIEEAFHRHLGCRDAAGAVECLLELEQLLVDWSRDTLQSDELDRGRTALRAMVVRLGEAAVAGVRDPAEVLAPYVEAVLDARHRARAEGRFDEADTLRDRLTEAGLEVRDTGDGTEWQLR